MMALLPTCILLLIGSVCSSFVDFQKRMKFIQAMDEATRQTRSFENFQRQLLDKAMPATRPLRLLEQNDDQYNENMLDLENYALKYTGCQSIKTWSDNKAQDEGSDTVFAMKRFVVFRMCPANHCSSHNSHGCNSDYGEYMITMENYLALMAQYHYARYAEYCSTCATCFTSQQVSYQSDQQYGGNVRRLDEQKRSGNVLRRLADDDAYNNDDAAAAGDDAYQTGDDAYQAGDDYYAYQNDDAAAAGDDAYQAGDDAYQAGDDYYATRSPTSSPTASPTEQGDDFYAFVDDDYYKDDDNAGGNGNGSGCRFSQSCNNYQSICSTFNANDRVFQNYFSCIEFKMGNQVVYLGPHCNKDGHSITLGAFDDDECSNYLGDIANMQEFTGIAFQKDSLSFYYPSTCISCANQDHWSLGNDNSGGDVYDLCEALYDTSAKCHKYLSEDSDAYESENQEQTEGSVCNFIQSLEENHYDEYGEINLANLYFDTSKWADYHQYTKFVSPTQIACLVVSIMLFLGLLIYSCCLHNALTQAARARKPRGQRDFTGSLLYHKQPPPVYRGDQISPVYSGITKHRSHGDSSESAHTPSCEDLSATSSQRSD